MSVSREMPRYQCHKKVWALKIEKIKYDGCERMFFIFPVDKNYLPFAVKKEYVDKHKPKEGGYYVLYEDGYESFSPADAFESGYTRI